METQPEHRRDSLEIDLGRLAAAVLRRKGILLLALAAGLAAGLAWHAATKKRYRTTISFVRNQTMDDMMPMGGLGSLSLLGMGGMSTEPPLIKFVDKYVKSREFLAQLRADTYKGTPLARALAPDLEDTTAEAFYRLVNGRVKILKETGLTSIRVWDHDPELSLHLLNLVYGRFQADFDNARSKAIQENLAFASDLVAKSRRELSAASTALREFLERNRGLGSPALEQARNELLMKQRLAEERFILSEKERSALEIKNERKEQSLVVIEKPFLPASPIWPKRIVSLAIPVILALVSALVLIGFLDRKAWLRTVQA